MPPSRVGPYVIEKKIGSGGMGTVYYARHAETHQEAAVKVLPASLAQEEGFLVRFAREIDALKTLTNPHVVKLYDSGTDADTYYYAMEYVDGETLRSLLRRERRLPWQRVIEIALQICSALKAAHDAGIVHRDLKPSNLLIDRHGAVKLTDFGVAQVFAGTRLTKTGGIIGTAEYMSPEQAQGQRATKKSDLYSLGAVMYVMLTGRPPFTGQTTLDLMHKHRYAQFDRPRRIVPEIPHWLDDIVCRLLDKDPDKRFVDAYVLSLRLREVLKKVELAESVAEQTQVPHVDFDASAPTVAIEDNSATGTQSENDRQRSPGPGTLMRDLMRVEIERERQSKPLAGLFDNTWVLVGLLGLLIVGGLWWFRSQKMTPEERFHAAVALMQHPEGPDWLRARDEFLQPLVEADPERWQNKAQPYLNRVNRYDWELDFQSQQRRRKRLTPNNDVERFLLQAQHDLDAGDFADAERTLAALEILLDDSEEHARYRRLAAELRSELEAMRADPPGRLTLLADAMARAEKLADAGNWESARQIWRSIIALYQQNPAARDAVQRARDRLRQAPSESKPVGNGPGAHSEEEAGVRDQKSEPERQRPLTPDK